MTDIKYYLPQLESVEKCIAHYDRMIKYVNTLPKAILTITNSCSFMYEDILAKIKETYGPIHCSLCIYNKVYSGMNYECKNCVLAYFYGSCMGRSYKQYNKIKKYNSYRNMYYSDNWKNWLIHAKEVRKQLQFIKIKLEYLK